MGCISVAAVTAAYGFALTASPFCQTPQKEPKSLAPSVRHLAWARCSLAPVFIWGHRLRSASRRPPLDVCGFAARRYAPTPQMNTSTQPPEGAGRARSRAGELTLGLMSGEERCGVCRSAFDSAFVGARLAREGGLTADLSLSDALSPIVGASLLAKAACQPTHIFRMHSVQLWERGLPAKAACQPTHLFRMHSVQIVGAGLPAKAACQPTHIFRMHSVQLWERACSRRRPASQPISFGCTRSNCGSWLACEGGQPADLSLPDAPVPIVGASLLAKTP